MAPSAEPAIRPDAAFVPLVPPVATYVMSEVPLDQAFAINASGAIVGKVGGNAAMYAQGTVTLLPGKSGYTNLTALDIADNGFIVGTGASVGRQRGLFWASATAAPIDMGALGQHTTPRAINSAGTAVGSFLTTAAASTQAFRWSVATGMTVIAPPGAAESEAVDISETGFIAVTALFGGVREVVRVHPDGGVGRVTGPAFAFRARNDGSILGQSGAGSTLWNLVNTPTLVGPPPPHVASQISAKGRKVGSVLISGQGFRAWTTTGTSTTPAYLPAPVGASAFANDVNTCGNILGSVTLAGGIQKVVVWSRWFCDGVGQR